MKTEQQINAARIRITQRMTTPGLSQMQLHLLVGMLNALVWAADGKHTETMDRLLSDDPIVPGVNNSPSIDQLREILRQTR